MKRVEGGVTAGERPGRQQIRVHDDGADVLGIEGPRQAVDLDVPEAVRRVPGLERFTRAAGGDDFVNLSRRQEVAGSEDEEPQVLRGHQA